MLQVVTVGKVAELRSPGAVWALFAGEELLRRSPLEALEHTELTGLLLHVRYTLQRRERMSDGDTPWPSCHNNGSKAR